MTQLRQKMLEELQRRHYAYRTANTYLRIVRDFAAYFHQPPDKLGPEQIRQYQAFLFQSKKLSPASVSQYVSALRFLFVKTLRRHFLIEHIPFPKSPRRLPVVLSLEEVTRLINSAGNLFHRTLLMTLYSTALRRAELCRLKVTDIDSQRMMIRVTQGKGRRDREVPLSRKLLETLRVYWRWMRPKTYLFPGTVKGIRADVPITPNIIWLACRQAAQAAGIDKPGHPQSTGHPRGFQPRSGETFPEAAQKMNRPPLEVAHIVRAIGNRFLQTSGRWIHWSHRKVLLAIARCRTAALGGHRDQCPRCGYRAISFNSCRNRHCPKCQSQARDHWIAARQQELLPVPYVHVVFTLPHQLSHLALVNKKVFYDLLFHATAQTLLEIAADPKHLGAEIGFFAVLHSWGQNLLFHPHLHCVIPAGS